jgi:hypothetical protein
MSALDELESKPNEKRTPLEQCVIDAYVLEEERGNGDYTQMEQAAAELARKDAAIAAAREALRLLNITDDVIFPESPDSLRLPIVLTVGEWRQLAALAALDGAK